MKKTFLLLSALFAGISTAQAQSDLTDDYFRFEASYASMIFQHFDENANGFALGFLYGNSLSPDIPLFIEYGAYGSFGVSKVEATDGSYYAKETDKFFNIAAPVNLSYKIGLTDNISLVPFAGVNFKLNCVSYAELEATGYSKERYNLFDDEDVENTAKRFQFGANIGIGLNISNLYVGYRFQPDFNEYFDGVKSKTNYISLGVNF